MWGRRSAMSCKGRSTAPICVQARGPQSQAHHGKHCAQSRARSDYQQEKPPQCLTSAAGRRRPVAAMDNGGVVNSAAPPVGNSHVVHAFRRVLPQVATELTTRLSRKSPSRQLAPPTTKNKSSAMAGSVECRGDRPSPHSGSREATSSESILGEADSQRSATPGHEHRSNGSGYGGPWPPRVLGGQVDGGVVDSPVAHECCLKRVARTKAMLRGAKRRRTGNLSRGRGDRLHEPATAVLTNSR